MPISLGPEVAGVLLDEAFADGCHTVMVDPSEADPAARLFTHPDFDPVWARFAERDVPVILHIAVDGHYDPVSPSFKNNGRAMAAVGGSSACVEHLRVRRSVRRSGGLPGPIHGVYCVASC